MKKIALPLIAIALIATACDSSKTVTNNSYDDGIYHNPAKDDRHYAPANTDATINPSSSESFTLDDLENQETTTNPNANGEVGYYEPNGDEYYDPNANYSTGATGGTVVNNYYGGNPSYINPGINTGIGWNSWGGWGMSVGFGWGWGGGYYGGYYDPFFYSPWYGGYYGYRPYWGWGGGGYYGYNSYWNGYYNGYYHGSGGDYGHGVRNVVYVRNGNNAYR
ncbi:hypothetical protein [Owenweeksia hongkongensis]|nr:hypothetical protein [Owenweeksia hongkongensis]